MKLRKSPEKSQGFTIVELLIATLIFSIVLVLLLTVFVQISRMFYKGVMMSRTQEDTRNVVQSVASDIQFSQTASNFTAGSAPSSGMFCVGLHRYKYRIGYQLGSSSVNDIGIYRDNVSFSSGCNAAAPGSGGVELLDGGMQVNALSLNCANSRCVIDIRVVFYAGVPDMFHSNIAAYSSQPWLAPDAECTGALTDSQYCATAEYNTTVLQRN
jgi:prepilin-type N-terminal cleavage/methylation domain-containing protein